MPELQQLQLTITHYLHLRKSEMNYNYFTTKGQEASNDVQLFDLDIGQEVQYDNSAEIANKWNEHNSMLQRNAEYEVNYYFLITKHLLYEYRTGTNFFHSITSHPTSFRPDSLKPLNNFISQFFAQLP